MTDFEGGLRRNWNDIAKTTEEVANQQGKDPKQMLGEYLGRFGLLRQEVIEQLSFHYSQASTDEQRRALLSGFSVISSRIDVGLSDLDYFTPSQHKARAQQSLITIDFLQKTIENWQLAHQPPNTTPGQSSE